MTTYRPEVIEQIAEAVHDAWMGTKRGQGVTSRPSEWGEEQMVPYGALSERAKNLDRGTVRAVLDALPVAGFELKRRQHVDPPTVHIGTVTPREDLL